MQLAGELAKMNLASLIRLVRNGELTGKVCLTQGVNTASIYFVNGQPVHLEADHGNGREALLELFCWRSGTFSYIECPVSENERSLSLDEPLERLLKEGLAFQEAQHYLEQLRISTRTVFKSTVKADNDEFLAAMNGRLPLGEIVASLGLLRSDYVIRLQQYIANGKVLVVEAPAVSSGLELPDWVVSRLKQDNPDISQSIVDLVIWADRIKCWLYQADVDLMRVIQCLENESETGQDSTEAQTDELAQSPEQESLPSASGSEPEPAPVLLPDSESDSDEEELAEQIRVAERELVEEEPEPELEAESGSESDSFGPGLSAVLEQVANTVKTGGSEDESKKQARPPSYEF